jgi:outer membrane lipoprotein carrier protein
MVSALIVAAALAATSPVDDKATVVAGLQAWLDGTSTLDVRFRQSLVSSALGTTASETGRLYLERPGKLRWDYLEPEKKVALLIGDRTELYLEEERLLSRGRLTGEQGLFPRLLAGHDRVEALFSANLVATPSTGGNGSYRLRLVPRVEPASATAVTLTLHPRDFAIEAAEVLDDTGNRTTYTFSSLRRNRALPDGLFAFEPPPGTEVVNDR